MVKVGENEEVVSKGKLPEFNHVPWRRVLLFK
jgi:hypothetical protein